MFYIFLFFKRNPVYKKVSGFFFLFLLNLLLHNFAHSQAIRCGLDITCIEKKELLNVYKHYISSENVTNKIVLIDYRKVDSFNLYRVTDSENIFEMMYKKPDCFFIKDSNICYIYTKRYLHEKDSVWLDKAFRRSREILNAPNIDIAWSNDSVLSIRGYFHVNSEYTPSIIEYKVYQGIIKNKKFVENMFYNVYSKPKNIKTFR